MTHVKGPNGVKRSSPEDDEGTKEQQGELTPYPSLKKKRTNSMHPGSASSTTGTFMDHGMGMAGFSGGGSGLSTPVDSIRTPGVGPGQGPGSRSGAGSGSDMTTTSTTTTGTPGRVGGLMTPVPYHHHLSNGSSKYLCMQIQHGASQMIALANALIGRLDEAQNNVNSEYDRKIVDMEEKGKEFEKKNRELKERDRKMEIQLAETMARLYEQEKVLKEREKVWKDQLDEMKRECEKAKRKSVETIEERDLLVVRNAQLTAAFNTVRQTVAFSGMDVETPTQQSQSHPFSPHPRSQNHSSQQ